MKLSTLLVFSGAAALLSLACSVEATSTPDTSGPDGTTDPTSSNDTKKPSDSTKPPSTTPPDTTKPLAKARIRLRHGGFQTGFVDYCLVDTKTNTTTGPILADAGEEKGANFGSSTRYLELEPGDYEVRVLSSSNKKASCDDKPMATSETPVTLAPDARISAYVIGNGGLSSGNEALRIVPVADDAAAASGKIALRFLNGATGFSGNATVMQGFSDTLFDNVKYGEVATSSPKGSLSANHYLELDAATLDVSVKARSQFDGDKSAYLTYKPEGGKAYTMMFGGYASSGFVPPQIVLCEDDDSVIASGDAFAACGAAR